MVKTSELITEMLQELASNQKEVNNSNNVGMIPVASE